MSVRCRLPIFSAYQSHQSDFFNWLAAIHTCQCLHMCSASLGMLDGKLLRVAGLFHIAEHALAHPGLHLMGPLLRQNNMDEVLPQKLGRLIGLPALEQAFAMCLWSSCAFLAMTGGYDTTLAVSLV